MLKNLFDVRDENAFHNRRISHQSLFIFSSTKNEFKMAGNIPFPLLAGQEFRHKNVNLVLFTIITPSHQMMQLRARSESAELMEYGGTQQMLPTLMEVTTEKNLTYCVDYILRHASIVVTYAATCCEFIIPLQDMLLFPTADERLQYNSKKASNFKCQDNAEIIFQCILFPVTFALQLIPLLLQTIYLFYGVLGFVVSNFVCVQLQGKTSWNAR